MNGPTRDDLPLESADWPRDASPADGLRGAIWEQTSGIVRRRAGRRRLRLAASWGLAYAAGIATAWLAWPRERALVAPTPPRPKVGGNAVEQVAAAPSQPRVAEDLSTLSPEELRSRVADAPRPEQLRLLRLAGDRYLFGRADVGSALDCYRQVIELTPRAELARREDDDSWLLAELKSSAAGSVAQFTGE